MALESQQEVQSQEGVRAITVSTYKGLGAGLMTHMRGASCI